MLNPESFEILNNIMFSSATSYTNTHTQIADNVYHKMHSDSDMQSLSTFYSFLPYTFKRQLKAHRYC